MWLSGLLCCTTLAQIWTSPSSDPNLGLRAGLSYQFGTQANRVGLNAAGFAQVEPTDTTFFMSWSGYRTLSHIQTSESGWERELSLGVTQGIGGKRSRPDPYDWSLAANNSDRNHSLSAYTTLYRDSYGTSQRNMGLGFNVDRFNVRFENDYSLIGVLGDQGDRFRTGALELGYRSDGRTNWVTGFSIFTGDTEQGENLEVDEGGPLPHGIYTMRREDGSWVDAGERSIGNAYVGVRGLNLGNPDDSALQLIGADNLQLRLGWSSEGVRHSIQNRFHDLIRDPRIPVRDTPGQLYVEFGTNAGQTLYP